MLTLRPAESRGHTQINWLDSYHTFSFGEYYDPNHAGFSDLLVINDDTVKPAGGFRTHGHQDMEIITLVLSGKLEHKDSMGNGSVIEYGDVQRMSAGTGITHSEFNHSKTDPVHFLQLWIQPNQKDVTPGYEQKNFSTAQKLNQLCLIVSGDGRNNSVKINQDAEIYGSVLECKQSITYTVPQNRKTWIHVASGAIHLNGQLFEAGDGVGIQDETKILLEGIDTQSEFLIFNLQ